MQDQTPIYYRRDTLRTEPQDESRKVKLLRERLTSNMRRMLIDHADAKQCECVGFDPTDPSFTVIYLSFSVTTRMVWYVAKQIADGLAEAENEGVELYELTALTNLSSADPHRFRVKLVIDVEKYL